MKITPTLDWLVAGSIPVGSNMKNVDRNEVISIGRKSFLSMAHDLKIMHGLDIKTDYTDEECYKQGVEVIEWNLKADELHRQEQENDRRYLASLDPEYRQYILLKRKYDPTEMGGV